MGTIVEYAQGLVYSFLCLMPSTYQKASLNALFGLFLEDLGHPLPQQTQVKLASSLSRFLNYYTWPTRSVIRTTRQAVLQQIAQHPPHSKTPLRVLIDLTSLDSCGKFLQLSTSTNDPEAPDPWVRIRWRQAGTTFGGVVFGNWRVASKSGAFGSGFGLGYASPVQLACKLLATVPTEPTSGQGGDCAS